MRKPLFIAIGVHKPKYMDTLPGVIASIDHMCDWASKSYEVTKIDDRKNPVTIDRIRSELTPLNEDGVPDPTLLLDRPRIVVYFCGHGIADWPDQYWILSAGPRQTRERISANGFRDTLATYDPKQISFISDACRSPAPLVGTGDTVVDWLEGDYSYPQKDIFYSCQDGKSSFAVPPDGDRPGYPVFSSVLQRAFAKPDGVNVDALMVKAYKRRTVTSQSLKSYLDLHVPKAALAIDRIQSTQCDAGFAPLDHIYEEFVEPTGAEKADPPPLTMDFVTDPISETIHLTSVSEAMLKEFHTSADAEQSQSQDERINASRSEWRAPLVRDIQNLLLDFPRPTSIATVGFKKPYATFLGEILASRPERRYSGRFERNVKVIPIGIDLWYPGNTVLLTDGTHALTFIPMFPDMHCVCFVDEHAEPYKGVEFLSWLSLYGDTYREGPLHSAEALKGLSRGILNPSDATRIAGEVRYAKHLDPMMGLVAAYLYNATGDIDNLHRMAYYYLERRQPIPFDIALLGRLPLHATPFGFETEVPAVREVTKRAEGAPDFTWNATPSMSGPVAGMTPVLRAGWPYLRRSSHRFHRMCWEFIDNLAPSPVSTFVGDDVVHSISKAFKETRS